MQFIHYKDSIYHATHTKAYLDSMDRLINKITWKKVLIFGQTFNNHEKQRTWYTPSLLSLYQPLQFGGTRMLVSTFYEKTFTSRKTVSVSGNISYGIRNQAVNGSVSVTHLYNPFNRGFVKASAGREFEFIFSGDAWINMVKRSNIYLNNQVAIGHGLELINGLFLYTDLDMAFRRSVSHYKTIRSLTACLVCPLNKQPSNNQTM